MFLFSFSFHYFLLVCGDSMFIVYIPENIVLYCLKKIKKFDEIYVFGSLEIVNKNISENCAYDSKRSIKRRIENNLKKVVS